MPNLTVRILYILFQKVEVVVLLEKKDLLSNFLVSLKDYRQGMNAIFQLN